MRFPKEKVLITKEVNDSLNRGDFFSIFKMKNRIIDNFEVLEPEVFSRLLASTFIIGNFDEAVIIGLELRTRGIETYDTLYYLLLSLIANNDIYQALSIINRSKLLNRQEIKEFHQEDGANYSNLLAYADHEPEFTLLLLIVNYIKGLANELNNQLEKDLDYSLFRFFDLINLVYELGYPLKIMQELSSIMKIIFNLSI
jgi:hypothetical protein